jgi:hypothetical protein
MKGVCDLQTGVWTAPNPAISATLSGRSSSHARVQPTFFCIPKNVSIFVDESCDLQTGFWTVPNPAISATLSGRSSSPTRVQPTFVCIPKNVSIFVHESSENIQICKKMRYNSLK